MWKFDIASNKRESRNPSRMSRFGLSRLSHCGLGETRETNLSISVESVLLDELTN
jgi:hypothetical protein